MMYDPLSGKKLFQRKRAGRIPGYDITADPPKSVTLAQLVADDDTLPRALREAGYETLRHDIEPALTTRDYDHDGQRTETVTGNMVYSGWEDFDTRPAGEDGLPDPQMHMHFFCMMGTYHAAKNRWQTANFGTIKTEGFYYEAAFHARLAKKLVDQGLHITPVKGGRFFELTGVPRALIETFSKRTQEIRAEAEKRGITDPQAIDALGDKPAAGKRKSPSKPSGRTGSPASRRKKSLS